MILDRAKYLMSYLHQFNGDISWNVEFGSNIFNMPCNIALFCHLSHPYRNNLFPVAHTSQPVVAPIVTAPIHITLVRMPV